MELIVLLLFVNIIVGSVGMCELSQRLLSAPTQGMGAVILILGVVVYQFLVNGAVLGLCFRALDEAKAARNIPVEYHHNPV